MPDLPTPTQHAVAGIPKYLRELVSDHATRLHQIDDAVFSARPEPDKWSRKEVLGHLIDSAQNNLRRFITSRYEEMPPHIVYDQDFWVNANAYQDMSKSELITLWKLINDRVAAVIEAIPASKLESLCNTGKGKDELHTLRFLAGDYVSHLQHHLRQILNS